jgi:hypothetical protein
VDGKIGLVDVADKLKKRVIFLWILSDFGKLGNCEDLIVTSASWRKTSTDKARLRRHDRNGSFTAANAA